MTDGLHKELLLMAWAKPLQTQGTEKTGLTGEEVVYQTLCLLPHSTLGTPRHLPTSQHLLGGQSAGTPTVGFAGDHHPYRFAISSTMAL